MRLFRNRKLVPENPREAELARQRAAVGPNGWTCHVCGDYRPDKRISVYSTARMIGLVPIRQNVRYCNDRPRCAAGAPDVTFGGS